MSDRAELALVTGGASGIGRAVATRLARAGRPVALADLAVERAEEVAAELNAAGGEARAYQVDVSDSQSVAALAARVEDEQGTVAGLVNCAGVNVRVPTAELAERDWDRVIDINLKGTFLVCQAIGGAMVRAGGGAIVNLCSMLAHFGGPNLVAYGASKGGVAMVTRCLAVEWAAAGVRVNAVSPGYIDTPLTHAVLESRPYGQKLLDRTPLARFGTPEDVARTIEFLLSPEADFITGQILPVDGGFLAGDPSLAPVDQRAAADGEADPEEEPRG